MAASRQEVSHHNKDGEVLGSVYQAPVPLSILRLMVAPSHHAGLAKEHRPSTVVKIILLLVFMVLMTATGISRVSLMAQGRSGKSLPSSAL